MSTEVCYPVHSSYRNDNNSVVFSLFCRTENGEKKEKIIKGIVPYFYIPEGDFVPDLDEIVGVAKGKMSINGIPTKKIFVKTPRDIGKIKHHFTRTFEADVPFTNRQRIDYDLVGALEMPTSNQISIGDIIKANIDNPIELRKFIYDIETIDKYRDENGRWRFNTINQMKDGKIGIPSMVFYDNFTDTYYVFTTVNLTKQQKSQVRQTLREYWKQYPKFAHEGECKIQLHYSPSEQGMLNDVAEFCIKNNPDIVVGWNNEDFDDNTWISRSKEVGAVYAGRIARVSEYGGRKRTKFNSFISMDLMQQFTFIQSSTVKFAKLDVIATDLLGVGKLPRTAIGEMLEDDPAHLIAYNIVDVQLTRYIEEHISAVNFFKEISEISHSSLDEHSSSNFIDNFIMEYVKDDFTLPTKPTKVVETDKKVGGGMVYDAIIGLHKNVIVLDYKGLYPSIMRSLNMSIETKSEDGDIVAANGVRFRSDIKGKTPEILEILTDLRNKYKALVKAAETAEEEQIYDLKQIAVKILSNAFYGVLLYKKFRLMDADIGDAITSTGRDISLSTKKFIEDMGFKVIYGDTDSLFILAPDNVEGYEETNALAEDLAGKVNVFLDELAKERYNVNDHVFFIEVDKIFTKLFQANKKSGEDDEGAKKRYAGYQYNEDGGLDFKYKGFEIVRANTATITSELQIEVLKAILDGKERKEIRQIFIDLKAGMKTRHFSDFGKRVKIKEPLANAKNSPTKRGALYSNAYLDKNYDVGDEMLQYFIEPMAGNHTEICLDHDEPVMPDKHFVDYDLMWDKLIKSPLISIVESNGITWNYIETGKVKKALF